MKLNKYIIPGIAAGFFIAGIYAWRWESANVNWKGERNLHTYLQNHPYQSTILKSLGSTFQADYIPNASTDCINPHFPVIRISTNKEHNAWIQIVHTDTPENQWKKFVDTTEDKKTFPFYAFDQDFYDAPLWTYKLFSKPLSFWKGHAYAVQVDHEKKTILCIGGIEWGFTLSFSQMKPHCLTPRVLSEDEWNTDWEFFQKSLPGYALLLSDKEGSKPLGNKI